MRLPKRGERGFTLIELLIVVAILGVLAAVVIPNVTRFFGKGEDEARRTEYHNVSLAVASMMIDNGISSISDPAYLPDGTATNDMTNFPDFTSSPSVPPTPDEGKVIDPDGFFYAATGEEGYVLFGHDIYGSGFGATPLPEEINPKNGDADVNYLNMSQTVHFYTCEPDGTVRQWKFSDTTLPDCEYLD